MLNSASPTPPPLPLPPGAAFQRNRIHQSQGLSGAYGGNASPSPSGAVSAAAGPRMATLKHTQQQRSQAGAAVRMLPGPSMAGPACYSSQNFFSPLQPPPPNSLGASSSSCPHMTLPRSMLATGHGTSNVDYIGNASVSHSQSSGAVPPFAHRVPQAFPMMPNQSGLRSQASPLPRQQPQLSSTAWNTFFSASACDAAVPSPRANGSALISNDAAGYGRQRSDRKAPRGVPPPVARGPQPTCMEPTRLRNGQRVRRHVSPAAHQITNTGPPLPGSGMGGANGQPPPRYGASNGARRGSRFASMRHLPGGIKLDVTNLEDDSSESGATGQHSVSSMIDDAAGNGKAQVKKKAGSPKTGPGAAGFRPPVAPPPAAGKRQIKTTVGNDNSWMVGLTDSTWVVSPDHSMRGGENGPYKRRPNERNRSKKGRKKREKRSNGDSNDSVSDDINHPSGNSSQQPKKTFLEKFKSLFS